MKGPAVTDDDKIPTPEPLARMEDAFQTIDELEAAHDAIDEVDRAFPSITHLETDLT